MRKTDLVILRNEIPDDHLLWISACRDMADVVNWRVVDITRSDWLEALFSSPFDGILATVSGMDSRFRQLMDERLSILHHIFGCRMYPSWEELTIYENKRFQAYWLRANKIPHPATNVFYYLNEAAAFLEKTAYPVVAKTSVGAGGSGVVILKNNREALTYAEEAFSAKGIRRRSGPKWSGKGFLKRAVRKVFNPAALSVKLQKYMAAGAESQTGFVIFQEYIPHEFEWRCVRIGDSYFGHKKVKKGEMASGSLIKDYTPPPPDLLDFVREVTSARGFLSQAVDIFVAPDGAYLVNEMQCLFGQSDPYQMLVDGVPGRFVRKDGSWVFEGGDFNRIESYLLRLQHFLQILGEEK